MKKKFVNQVYFLMVFFLAASSCNNNSDNAIQIAYPALRNCLDNCKNMAIVSHDQCDYIAWLEYEAAWQACRSINDLGKRDSCYRSEANIFRNKLDQCKQDRNEQYDKCKDACLRKYEGSIQWRP